MVKWNPRTIIERLGKQRERGKLTAQQCANGMSNFVYVFIWAWYILNLTSFCNELYGFSPVDGWSFGQIVAITVWAAPIVEFAKPLVQRIKRGFDDQIPSPYRVTNTEKSEEHNTDSEALNFTWLQWKLRKYYIPPTTNPKEVLRIF
ncbi:MAG: hypothetical protein Q9225_005800 [Loekoesia sp. 1 TL-2023]